MNHINYARSQGYLDYTLAELEAMPTISESQADDLKVESEDGRERVWLSRVSALDGAYCDNEVTVEFRIDDRWITIARYEALSDI